jgi:hypothetical protein
MGSTAGVSGITGVPNRLGYSPQPFLTERHGPGRVPDPPVRNGRDRLLQCTTILARARLFRARIPASRKFCLNSKASVGRKPARRPHISRSKKPGCIAPRPARFNHPCDYYDARRNGFINPFVSGCVLEVATFCPRADSSFVCSERVSYALRAQAVQTSTSSDGV